MGVERTSRPHVANWPTMARAVLSLKRVNTTVPIHLLVSGERVPTVEARFTELGHLPRIFV